MIEPQLTGVEDDSAVSIPMIRGDAGLSECVPLDVMGGGMTGITRVILTISATPSFIRDSVHHLENSISSESRCSQLGWRGNGVSGFSWSWRGIGKQLGEGESHHLCTVHHVFNIDPFVWLMRELEPSGTISDAILHMSNTVDMFLIISSR